MNVVSETFSPNFRSNLCVAFSATRSMVSSMFVCEWVVDQPHPKLVSTSEPVAETPTLTPTLNELLLDPLVDGGPCFASCPRNPLFGGRSRSSSQSDRAPCRASCSTWSSTRSNRGSGRFRWRLSHPRRTSLSARVRSGLSPRGSGRGSPSRFRRRDRCTPSSSRCSSGYSSHRRVRTSRRFGRGHSSVTDCRFDTDACRWRRRAATRPRLRRERFGRT